MTQAQSGQTVSVEYTGKLQDGTVFDSNVGGQPLSFELGAGQVIPGFDDAVAGMTVGDSVEVTIPPEQAYGQPSEQLILELPIEQFPQDMEPEVGMQIQLTAQDGRPIPAAIAQVKTDSVIVDANHRLAGKTLVFDIKLLNVS